MRPVERGPRPRDVNNVDIQYTDYKQARSALIERMGQYCSYCNQKLPASLAVEHVQPKNPVPALTLEWTNFLLGCTNCNSTKGGDPINMDEYVWPDLHNTHLAFKYNPDGTIDINPQITDPTLRRRIQNMISLVGLQKYPDDPTASDRRWKNRRDAYQKARNALFLLEEAIQRGAGDIAASYIAQWAPDSGFFSIWFNMFENHPDVRAALINAFPGSALSAFNQRHVAITRSDVL